MKQIITKDREQINLVVALLFLLSVVFGVLLYPSYLEHCNSYLGKRTQVTIGINIPQTGELAYIGDQIKKGIDLALEEIASSEIEILYQDSKGVSKDGLSAMESLLQKKPDFVITNLTTVCMASRPKLSASAKKLNAVYLCTHPDILTGTSNGFRFFTSGKQESDLITDEFLKSDEEKVGIMYIDDSYGVGTAEYIKDQIRSVRPDIQRIDLAYSFQNNDFKHLLNKAKLEELASIILIGYGNEYDVLFKTMRELDYSPKIYGNFSFANKKGEEVEKYKGKIFFTAPIFSDKSKRSMTMESFNTRFVDKYGSEPDFNAAYAYDNIKIISDFVRSRQKDFKSFLSTHEYEGAMGRYTFLPNGDVITELHIVER